jgi:hypothetical protein
MADSKHKNEPGDRYKKNQQEALDPFINGLTASTNSESPH